MSCGSRHSALVTQGGDLYTCGTGEVGQLGVGKSTREYFPKIVSNIPDTVVKASAGLYHTLILTKNGYVYATGGNNFG